MRNRPFSLPVQKPDLPSKAPVQENFKNLFCGKKLFRSNLYHLVIGNVSILDTIDNEWFLDELFRYSSVTHDPSILKALKKIASAGRFDESIRQHASEIAEVIEAEVANSRNSGESSFLRSDEKSANALKILAGIRYPQTTEVLRLMRDKSPELKRLALWLIGKFRMTDLCQEVCECLGIRGLEEDAFSVLIALGSDAGRDLKRHYLTSSGNMGISKAILRLFSKTCPKESMSFLLERLWSTSRQLREITLKALISCGYLTNDEEKERLRKMIYDTFGILTWILSGKVSLVNNEDALLHAELDKEYQRWKEFLLNLLILTYGDSVPVSSAAENAEKKDDNYASIADLADTVFTIQRKTAHKPEAYGIAERKTLKKLQKYFAFLIPEYYNLLEDIINYDYNVISIWTKACAIRSLKGIGGENMKESAVALLFSPEEILREEATRLIARTGMDLYRISSDRIREQHKIRLDNIITGRADENSLVFEKVKFLARWFGPINEDELIFLAERTRFLREVTAETAAIEADSIIWTIANDNHVIPVIVNHAGRQLTDDQVTKLRSCSYCYVLPFGAIEEFGFQYPENTWEIYRYIDKNEA